MNLQPRPDLDRPRTATDRRRRWLVGRIRILAGMAGERSRSPASVAACRRELALVRAELAALDQPVPDRLSRFAAQ